MTRFPWPVFAMASMVLLFDVGCGGSSRSGRAGDANAGASGSQDFDAAGGVVDAVGPVSSGGAIPQGGEASAKDAGATGGVAVGSGSGGAGGLKWDGGVDGLASGGIDALAASSGGQVGGSNDGSAGANGGAGQGGASSPQGGTLSSSSSSSSSVLSCPASPPTKGASCSGQQDGPCIYQDCAGSGLTVAFCSSSKWDVSTGACTSFTCFSTRGGAGGAISTTCSAGQVCVKNWAANAKCVTPTCGTGPINTSCVPGGNTGTEGRCWPSATTGTSVSSVDLVCCPYKGSAC